MSSGKMGLVLPARDAEFRSSAKLGTGDWGSWLIMDGGANNPYKGFTSPACDKLALRATFDAPVFLDRAHLSMLSTTTGLSFKIQGGIGGIDFSLAPSSQSIESRPTSKQSQNIRWEGSLVDQIQVVITGLAGTQIDVRQIIFGTLFWTPDQNYNWSSPLNIAAKYKRKKSNKSNYQRLDDKTRSRTLNFERMSEENYLDLQYFVDELCVDGLCLFEADVTSNEVRDSYLVSAEMGGVDRKGAGRSNTQLQLIEAFT
jgi:hypothetical protein